MAQKTITKEEFEQAKQKYEEAVQARANTIFAYRGLGWKFKDIGLHFGISRQAAEKIYRERKGK